MKGTLRKLLSLRQAAEVLNLKPHTLYSWISKRKIVFVRLGRRVMFDPLDLEKVVAEGKVETRKNQKSQEQ